MSYHLTVNLQGFGASNASVRLETGGILKQRIGSVVGPFDQYLNWLTKVACTKFSLVIGYAKALYYYCDGFQALWARIVVPRENMTSPKQIRLPNLKEARMF